MPKQGIVAIPAKNRETVVEFLELAEKTSEGVGDRFSLAETYKFTLGHLSIYGVRSEDDFKFHLPFWAKAGQVPTGTIVFEFVRTMDGYDLHYEVPDHDHDLYEAFILAKIVGREAALVKMGIREEPAGQRYGYIITDYRQLSQLQAAGLLDDPEYWRKEKLPLIAETEQYEQWGYSDTTGNIDEVIETVEGWLEELKKLKASI